MMDLVRKQVYHRQFGVGQITDQAATTVTVEFCEEFGTKKFLYPVAFESYLVLDDGSAKAQVDSELQQMRDLAQVEREMREKEAEQRRETARLEPAGKRSGATISRMVSTPKATLKKARRQSDDSEFEDESDD